MECKRIRGNWQGVSDKIFVKEVKVRVNVFTGDRNKWEEGHYEELVVGRSFGWCMWHITRAIDGILIIADLRFLELIKKGEGKFMLSWKFKKVLDSKNWIFAGIYGLTLGKDRNRLWHELGAIRGLWMEPWYVGDDFNTIMYPIERYGQWRISSSMTKFLENTEELEL